MSLEAARQLAHALMFEGYVLYPYRKSSLKNQKRMVFGSLYPAAHAELSGQRAALRVELLIVAPSVQVQVLLLHWAKRRDPGETPWLEAEQREVSVGPLALESLLSGPQLVSFVFPAFERSAGGSHFTAETITGALRVSAERVAPDAYKLTLALRNESRRSGLPGGDELELAELMSFGAAHLLVHCSEGELVSLLEPPEHWHAVVQGCKNDGVWPVLVGQPHSPRTMLASPITLYDFPVVAPESPGDYYDATEIDEMLALRVRTMTDDEKAQACRTDPRARRILERSEGLTEEQLLSLHGAWRQPQTAPVRAPKPGDKVRLRPRPGRDVLDLALAGELATVVSLEQDFEGRRYCTVTVDADPGRDLGLTGQPGHRFYFELEEVEPAT
jgi:hypothetical protein